MELNQNDRRGDYRLPSEDDADRKRCNRVFISRKKIICFVITVSVLTVLSAVIGTVVSIESEENGAKSELPAVSNRSRKTTGERRHSVEPWKHYRLPRSILPELYWLLLRINMTDSYYYGQVKITVLVKETTQFIILHADPVNMKFKKIEVRPTGKGSIKVKEARTFNEYLVIETEELLVRDNSYIIRILFNAPFRNFPSRGLYKVSNSKVYDKKKGEWVKGKETALTMFFPNHARKNFPCFDDPSMKARFTLTLMFNEGYRALSNMPLQAGRKMRNLNIVRFQTTPKMPTYLLNYVISDYTGTMTTTESGTRIGVWSPQTTKKFRSFSLEIANKTLSYYEALFGRAYSLPKLDMVSIPNFAYRGMENWGIINYLDHELLYRGERPTETLMTKQSIALLVAHEIVHQWFGNLVTLKWWNDVIIHEGVADYFEFFGAANALPSYHIMQQFYNIEVRGAMKEDMLRSARCISQEVKSSREASKNVITLVYRKGAAILRMLHQYVGDAAFINGMRLYLKKFAHGNADQNDMWDSISETSNMDVSSVMQSWTKQAGFPIITVRIADNGRVFLSQRRFIFGENFPGHSDNSTWRVPLTYTTSKNPKKINKYLMTSKNVTINAEGDWIKLNFDASGYYVVNYDAKNWQGIIKQLRENHSVFTAIDRASLIKDAFTMAEEGLLPIEVALDTTTYLHKETGWIPWQYAKHYINEMTAKMPTKSRLKAKLIEYFWKKAKPLLTEVGWDEQTTLGGQLLQETAVSAALNAGDENATLISNEMFRRWLKYNSYIPQKLQGVIVFYGVMNGEDNEWQSVLTRYGFTTAEEKRKALLNALGASTETWRLQKLLELATMTRFIPLGDAINAVADGGNLGRSVAWNFVKTNWYKLPFSSSTDYAVTVYVQHMAERFTNIYHYNDLYAFLKRIFGKRRFPGYIKRVLNQIKSNIRWLKMDSAKVEAWLEKEHSHRAL